jgi:hypothetical protein
MNREFDTVLSPFQCIPMPKLLALQLNRLS